MQPDLDQRPAARRAMALLLVRASAVYGLPNRKAACARRRIERASERERAHGGLSSYATLRRRSPGKVGRERKAPLCDTPLEILRAEGLRGAGERERESDERADGR